MDFERQRRFLLDGEDPPPPLPLRRWAVERRIIFLEFMYVDVARDFAGVVFHVLLDGAKGSHNQRECFCFDPPHIRST